MDQELGVGPLAFEGPVLLSLEKQVFSSLWMIYFSS